MTFGIVFQKLDEPGFPEGSFYAHVPALGLTTHGEGLDGARLAACDLIKLWVAEKREQGEPVAEAVDCFYTTVELTEDALQGS